MKPGTSGYTSISFLTKSPDIRLFHNIDEGTEGQQDIALSFNKNSPQGDRFEIKNGGSGLTNVTAKISYVDSYNELHGTGVRKHFTTYLENDMQVMGDDNSLSNNQNNSILSIQLPGSVSESAKRAGINMPWQETLSITNVAVAALIAIMTAISIRILWKRTDRPNV